MKKWFPLILLAVVAAGFGVWKWRGGKVDNQAPVGAKPAEALAKPGQDAPEKKVASGGVPDSFAITQDDDPIGTLRLEGMVVDAQELPVAGAMVVINANPTKTVKTEADGAFYFDKLVARPYTLVARAQNGVAGPVTARLSGQSEPVILHLRPAGAIEVTVVKSGSKAVIADAAVELRGLDVQTAATDKNGVARFDNVVADGYSVMASAKGLARQYGNVRATAGTTGKVTLELRKGAGVQGVVLLPNGSPASGALVMFSGASEWSQQADDRLDAQKTDEKGNFRFESLPAGSFRFLAKKEEYAPGSSDLISLDGETLKTGVIVKMGESASISGVVVNKEQSPVAGARVRIAESRDSMIWQVGGRQVFADDQGKFKITGLSRSKSDVIALHDSATSSVVKVDLAQRSEQQITLVLDVDGSISGIVVDTAGEPILGAQVNAFPDFARDGNADARGESRLRGFPEELTDAGGGFTLRGLKPGAYTLRASPAGSSSMPFVRDDVKAQTGQTNVRIVLPKDGAIKGKVTFADGRVPGSYTVSVGMRGTPFSNSDGSFELKDMPPKSFDLTVRGPEFEAQVRPKIVVLEGETTDVGTILVAKGRSISGRVLDAQGSAVAGASVRGGRMIFGDGSTSKASGGGPPWARNTKETESDDTGAFSLNGVGPGEISIVAEHPDSGRSISMAIPPGAESVSGITLSLAGFGMLQGMVKKAGAPAPQMIVTASSLTVPNAMFSVATGSDGAYRFDRLAPDNYKVSAMLMKGMMAGMGFHSKTITVVSGKTAMLDLSVDEGSLKLNVSLVESTGKPLGFSQVMLIEGTVTASNARQLQKTMGAVGSGYSAMSFSIQGKAVSFENLNPAQYSACAVSLPTEVKGMRETMDYADREGDNLPAFCTAVILKADTPEQSATLTVTAPKMIVPPG